MSITQSIKDFAAKHFLQKEFQAYFESLHEVYISPKEQQIQMTGILKGEKTTTSLRISGYHFIDDGESMSFYAEDIFVSKKYLDAFVRDFVVKRKIPVLPEYHKRIRTFVGLGFL